MKPSTVAAILAGFVVVTLVMRKKTALPSPVLADPNKRYDIAEYIADEEL